MEEELGIVPIGACRHASQGKPHQFLSCLLSQSGREGRAEAGREGGGERERGREERSFTNRDREREKHLLELPLTHRSLGIF